MIPSVTHAGRYNSRKAAEEYAEVIRSNGFGSEVKEATVYDVFCIRPEAHSDD